MSCLSWAKDGPELLRIKRIVKRLEKAQADYRSPAAVVKPFYVEKTSRHPTSTGGSGTPVVETVSSWGGTYAMSTNQDPQADGSGHTPAGFYLAFYSCAGPAAAAIRFGMPTDQMSECKMMWLPGGYFPPALRTNILGVQSYNVSRGWIFLGTNSNFYGDGVHTAGAFIRDNTSDVDTYATNASLMLTDIFTPKGFYSD